MFSRRLFVGVILHLWRSFMKNSKLHIMVECAILIALSFVLSMIKLFEMPFGGSVTPLSMLPVCLVGFMHGAKWGFGSAFVYSVLQMMTSSVFSWGLSPLVLVICIFADYILAFTVLGATGFFKNKGNFGLISGTFCAIFLRFLCHYISGVTIWASSAPESMNPFVYSLLYQGSYMLPECIFTMIGIVAICNIPAFKRILMRK